MSSSHDLLPSIRLTYPAIQGPRQDLALWHLHLMILSIWTILPPDLGGHGWLFFFSFCDSQLSSDITFSAKLITLSKVHPPSTHKHALDLIVSCARRSYHFLELSCSSSTLACKLSKSSDFFFSAQLESVYPNQSGTESKLNKYLLND